MVVAGRQRDQAAEPADVAEDLGPVGRADQALDAVDGRLAGGDVDPGPAVGLAHQDVVPSRAGCTSASAVGIVFSSRTSLRSDSGTSTGYWPVKHASQKPAPGAPVAATSRSSVR